MSSGYTIEPELVVHRLCMAAINYANAGNSDSAKACLAKATLHLHEVPEAKPELFESYSDVAKAIKDDYLFEAFTEALLEQRPDDHSRRFALAFHYSNKGNQDIAYYHYSILVNRQPNDGNWNNYGVTSDNLHLPIASVRAYRVIPQKLGYGRLR